MKFMCRKKILIAMSIATGFCLPSCIDENANVDFGKAFDNIGLVGVEIEVPLVKGVTVNMGDMLEQVKSPADRVIIDYIIEDGDTVVTAFYEHDKVEVYPLQDINEDFDIFKQGMGSINIADLLGNNLAIPQWILNLPGVTTTVPSSIDESHDEYVSFDGVTIPGDHKSKIDRIELKNAKIRLNVDYTNITVATPEFLEYSIIIPAVDGKTQEQVIKLLPNQDVPFSGTIFTDAVEYGDAANKVKLHVHLKGDGQTQISSTSAIQCSINFDTDAADCDFVVWGWFNYVVATGTLEEKLKTESLPANIQQCLSDGTKLIFEDPRLQFDIESNVGVPLEFILVELTGKATDGTILTISNNNDKYVYAIDASTWNTDAITEIPKLDTLKLNKDWDKFEVSAQEQYKNIFRTNLDSLSLQYKVRAKPVDLANIGNTPIQHLSKKANISAQAKATLPMKLGEGSIFVYDEKENEVDFGTVDVKLEDGSATLFIGYKNTLPLGIKANIDLLKADKTTVKTLSIEMEGNMDKSADWKPISFTIDKTEVDQVSDIKYMNVHFESGKVPDGKTAVFTKDKYISVRLAADAKNITVGTNDLNK